MSARVSGRRLAVAMLVLAVAGSAAAAATSGPPPVAGTARSEVTLLSLSVAGQPLSVGHLLLDSSLAEGTSAFTPLIANGRSYGTTSLSTGSVEIASMNSDTVLPTALSKLVTVVTPGTSMRASAGSTRAGVDTLGSVTVLGLPLALDGTLATTAGVDGGRAGAEKTLVVRNLAVPSIGGLLGALGLDSTKLPSSTLTTLVQQLGLVDASITDAKTALDAALGPLKPQLTAAEQHVATAQAAVDAAKATVVGKTAELGTATSALDAATQSLQAVLGTTPHLVRSALLGLPTALPTPTVVPTMLPTVLPTVVPTPTAVPTPLPTALPTDLPTALPSAVPTVLPAPSIPPVVPAGAQPAVDVYNAAAAAYTDAIAALDAATGVLNLANGALNTASSTVNALLSTVQTQVDALVRAITGVLGKTPLVSVDSFTIRTEASATSAGKGGQTAKVVGGEIQGVHVLGNDVLMQTTGYDRAELGDLVGAPLDLLAQQIDVVTGKLSSVLSSVPGLPTLSVPAPQIDLLSTTTSTNIAGGFGNARTTVNALSITIPAITIPAAVQLPTAVGALSVKAVGDVLTKPLAIAVGTMRDTASFRPGVQATNTGGPPSAGGPAGGGTFTGTPGSNPTGSNPTGSNPTGSNPTGSNPTGSNPTGGNPTGSGPGGSTPNGTPTAGGPLPRTGLPAGAPLLAVGLTAAGLLLARRRQDLRGSVPALTVHSPEQPAGAAP